MLGIHAQVMSAAEAALSAWFLHAYGPATSAQFARWRGAPPAWTATLFDRLTDLDTVDFDGSPAMINKGDADPPRGLRLLPYFDAYGIACHPRSLLFPGRAAERALAGGRPATSRCCSSTARWAECGTRNAPALGSRSASSRWWS